MRYKLVTRRLVMGCGEDLVGRQFVAARQMVMRHGARRAIRTRSTPARGQR